jgi:hypothetical protein
LSANEYTSSTTFSPPACIRASSAIRPPLLAAARRLCSSIFST